MKLNRSRLFLCAVLCGFAATSSVAFAADAAAGKDLYATKCKTCHAADGTGNAGLAKAMKVELRPLGSAEVQAMSDADLVGVITKGKGKMKPVSISEGDAANVVAYLRTLKK